MRKLTAILVIGAMPLLALGQSVLTWETTPAGVPMLDHWGAAVQTDFTDPTLGCLVQLIRTVGTTKVAPVITGNGVSGTDTLVAWTFCSNGSTPGLFSGSQDLGASYPIDTGSNIYVRVWDRPTAGGGALPADRAVPGFGQGWMYVDGTVHLPTGSAPDYAYDLGTIDASSAWTFLAIPEPSSMALGLVGLGAILIRRRMMRK